MLTRSLAVIMAAAVWVGGVGAAGAGENIMTSEQQSAALARQISIYIDRSPDTVYAFASNPSNLPRWATGLGGSIREVNGEWVADAPLGKIRIKFAEQNRFGILDHDVTLESGGVIHNPMRVVGNGRGSEVTFMLFRREGVSDQAFADDAAWVAQDLRLLKEILEQQP